MNAKQRIRAILRRQPHDRLGWDFLDARRQDIRFLPGPPLYRPEREGLGGWGHYEELLSQVPGFHGEVCMDVYGNILGRLEGKTKGECVRGALQDGWEGLDAYRFPTFDADAYRATLMACNCREDEKYCLCGLPIAVFSLLRDVRRMVNALMDTLEEPEYVTEYLSRVLDEAEPMLDCLRDAGADGIMIGDDWGTQNAPFINPRTFDGLFKPMYARLARNCHERGLDLVVHSCGCVYPLVGMMCEAGVDGFQFDQPELTGSRVWAEEFGGKAAFYCPVDIQKVLCTGDRQRIETTAAKMCDVFRANGGNLIAKDYPSPQDIGVKPEWIEWAMNTILAHSDM